jgi:hypothetical protein
MRTFWRGLQAAGALMMLAAGGLPAQDMSQLAPAQEGRRAGLWTGFGLGAGGESFDLRDGRGYSEQLYRPTVSIRLGGTPSQRLRLGGEILAWVNEAGDAVESLSSFLFIGQLYPMGAAGLYLKGGIGFGRNAIDFPDGYGVGDTGFAGLLGAGWEARLGRRFYLNPTLDLVEHRYDNPDGGDYRERLVNFGVSLLFQSGR